MSFFDEEWEQYMAGLVNEDTNENLEQPPQQEYGLPVTESTIAPEPSNTEHQLFGENEASYSIVRVWMNDGLRQNSPSQQTADYIHISGPGMYADNPLPNSVVDAPVETLLPTTDEDEIRRWKLIPCSACAQYDNYWACFTGKWQEQAGRPVEFSYANKHGPGVIDSKIECLADDDNGHPLLLVTMIVLRRGVESKIEFWGKRRIVGDEMTRLSAAEQDYCLDTELKRLF